MVVVECHLVVLLGRLVVVPLLPLPVVVRGRPAVAVPLLASVRLLPHTEPPQPVLRSLLPGPVHLAATLAMSHVTTREREAAAHYCGLSLQAGGWGVLVLTRVTLQVTRYYQSRWFKVRCPQMYSCVLLGCTLQENQN